MQSQLRQQPISIIGTDTNIGKTYVAHNIIKILVNKGKQIAALKPIACGTTSINSIQINEDSHWLFNANNVIKEFNDINPICFKEAIAPHIAAKFNKYDLTVNKVLQQTAPIIHTYIYDYMLIEGCGGLLVPLNETETYLDLLKSWQYPVVLVVGMKLGCLNHTLLTYQTLLNQQINILGWIANHLDPDMLQQTANLEYLQQKLKAPLLGINPYNSILEPTDNFYETFK